MLHPNIEGKIAKMKVQNQMDRPNKKEHRNERGNGGNKNTRKK